MRVRCGVHYCGYIAEVFYEDFGDFPVCLLHDAPATRRILEGLELPGAFWLPCGRPIVLPIDDLAEEHLEHVEARDPPTPISPGVFWISAADDPALAELEGRGGAHPDFDLMENR